MKKLRNESLLDQEELNFLHRIAIICEDFESSLTVLRRKRVSLDRALERAKKAKQDLYDHESAHAGALRDSRDHITDMSFMIEKYNICMKS